ncbi:MAG: UpxY family transcription antiterminator [Thermodesulfobacteriota bacterium]
MAAEISPDLEPRPPDAPHWYVIHTRSRHEAKVEERLRERGLETFLPRVTALSRRRDRRVYLQVPLFPGYLFIHTELAPPLYQEIIKLPGLVRILGIKGRQQPVPQETVESIRALVSSDRPYYPWPYLERGRRVRIMEGPLAGAEGIILERRERKRRLVVAVELFRRAVAVELEDEAVEPWPDRYSPKKTLPGAISPRKGLGTDKRKGVKR